MTKKYIAIVYTPFQLTTIKCLIEQGLVCSEILILDHSNQTIISQNHFSLKNNPYHFFKEILKLRLRKNYRDSRIFLIPHGLGILSNFISSRANVLEIRLYHEGVLSFYLPEKRNFQINVKKKIFSLLLIHKFSIEHFFPISNASYFYTPYPGLTVHKPINSLIKFKLPNYKFNKPIKGNALVLDRLDFGINKSVIPVINEIFKDHKITSSKVKLHPKQDFKDFEIRFQGKIIGETELLKDKGSIENLSHNLSPAIVVSTLSSSLFNLIPQNQDTIFYIIIPREKLTAKGIKFYKYLEQYNAIVRII